MNLVLKIACGALLLQTCLAAKAPDPKKFWLGKNYRGTHSTSRGLSSLLSLASIIPKGLRSPMGPLTPTFEQGAEDDGEQAADISFFDNAHRRFPSGKVLELGCGEGRAAGLLTQKYPSWTVHCFNLKGYKKTSRGPPIGGAVSFDTDEEIQRMLDHYGISLPPEASIPKVHLGDASLIPWPFADNFFHLMLSQATLSKISKLDIVLSEAARTLAPGGIAFLGMGAAQRCDYEFWSRSLNNRLMYCGLLGSGEEAVRVIVSNRAPFDDLPGSAQRQWIDEHRASYTGRLSTNVILNKRDANDFAFLCPKQSIDYNEVLQAALKHCKKFTPAWDRSVSSISAFLHKNNGETN